MYSPLQFLPGEIAKPDGSLSLAYLAGALRRAGYAVKILDCSVGDDDNSLEETFFHSTTLDSGLLRVGMSPEMIAKKISEYDVIGISSIFTPQTSMVLALIRLVKEVAPEKLVIAGGVNARSLRKRFYDSGVDIIALSEAEETIVQIAEALRGKRDLTSIPGIAFRNEKGKEIINPCGPVSSDLDQLPFPAWDLLPLKKYWDISRPHGGQFPENERIKYASLQTSRGCPFQCLYCHISQEKEDGLSGYIGRFRTKSIDRVLGELECLKNLGVEYVFFEDDSLFAKKNRAYQLFGFIKEMGLHLLDVNGINICHLLKNYGGALSIDMEFLERLSDAGFRFLTLPFESANQRILDKYASSKWNIETINSKQLLKVLDDNKIKAAGNYMVGYPDETEAEIFKTILMAKRHVEEGLNHALFFAVVPFPGSVIFNMVIANGQLDPNFDTDKMRWTKSILKNMAISSDALESVRQLAWLTVNREEYVRYKFQMVVDCPEAELAAPTRLADPPKDKHDSLTT
jgi:anaerobic magnesium-protoporphyrin IX monomethyl ester cyclase